MSNISPERFNKISDGLYFNLENAERVLQQFIEVKMSELGISSTNMGLIPDVIRQDRIYRLNKASVDACFQAVRQFNGSVSNNVKREAQKIKRSELIIE